MCNERQQAAIELPVTQEASPDEIPGPWHLTLDTSSHRMAKSFQQFHLKQHYFVPSYRLLQQIASPATGEVLRPGA